MENVVSISGGKDSAALRLLAIERGVEHVAVFADTGHEHPQTYEWLEYFERKTGPVKRVRADFSKEFRRKRKYIATHWPQDGVPMERVTRAIARLSKPTGNPFLDLCMIKGRFPSTKARFCSEMLKHEPIHYDVVEPLLVAGHEVVSWQGVRADESLTRRDLLCIEDVGGGLWNYRPILDWTADDVFAMHRRHGLEPNPLYTQGMGRVGCMPCIHSRKAEIREIAGRFPEEIQRVAEWEQIVSECSKRGVSSFFPHNKTPGAHQGVGGIQQPQIEKVVEWSRTGRGGMQYELDTEEPQQCTSIYGLCE